MSDRYRWQLAALLGATALILLTGIGLRDPWPSDEPRFALIARDMVESGQWLFPRVGGDLYPDKPPLYFWVVGVFYWITGSLKVAILLPSAVAGIGVIALVSDLARRLWNEETAIFCGGLLLVMLQFPLQMKSGQIDGFLCLLTTLGLYGLARHLLIGPSWGWYAAAGAATGLAIITKGVGFLPLLILLPFAWARRAGWPVAAVRWSDPRWLLAPALMLSMVATWLVPMLLTVTDGSDPRLLAYRDNILLQQTVTRYANSWGHINPIWYLFTNAASWLWLPVPLLLPWLIPAWRRDLRERNGATLLLGGWVLIVLVFFSLSDGKRSLYIFPAAPAVALIAGYHARALLEKASVRWTLFVAALLLGLTLVAAGGWLHENPWEQTSFSDDLDLNQSLTISAAAIGLLAVIAAAAFRPRHAHYAWGATVAIAWLGIAIAINPRIDGLRSGAAIVNQARELLPPGSTLGLTGWPEQFLLQWDGPAVHFGFRRESKAEIDDAIAWLARGLGNRLLISVKQLNDCFDADRLQPLGTSHRRRWYLADRAALTDDCRWPDRSIDSIVFYRPPRSLSLQVSREPTSVYRHVEVALVGG